MSTGSERYARPTLRLRHLISLSACGQNRQDGALSSLASHCSVLLIRVRPILCLISQHLYGARRAKLPSSRDKIVRTGDRNYRVSRDGIVRHPLCRHDFSRLNKMITRLVNLPERNPESLNLITFNFNIQAATRRVRLKLRGREIFNA